MKRRGDGRLVFFCEFAKGNPFDIASTLMPCVFLVVFKTFGTASFFSPSAQDGADSISKHDDLLHRFG